MEDTLDIMLFEESIAQKMNRYYKNFGKVNFDLVF